MMTERLLQYIWQFQYFNKKELSTTDGQSLEIIYQGLFNRNQVPDFTTGRLKVATGARIGTIVLHVNFSDLYKHMHDDGPNYNNVILHVVWDDDHKAGTNRFPTLTLSDRVPKVLLEQYRAWMEGN